MILLELPGYDIVDRWGYDAAGLWTKCAESLSPRDIMLGKGRLINFFWRSSPTMVETPELQPLKLPFWVYGARNKMQPLQL